MGFAQRCIEAQHIDARATPDFPTFSQYVNDMGCEYNVNDNLGKPTYSTLASTPLQIQHSYCTLGFKMGDWRFLNNNAEVRARGSRLINRHEHARLCTRCNLSLIEDERHIIMECTAYNHIRAKYTHIFNPNNPIMSSVMNTEHVVQLAELLTECKAHRASLVKPIML